MIRSLFFLLSGSILFSSCYSLKKSVDASLPYSESINWPEEYAPVKAPFFVHNEIDIAASPATVWEILVAAETWPNWYEGAEEVEIQDPATDTLTSESIFTWKTMGLNFTSTIIEFDPPYRLGWESRKRSIKGYHAWLIVPTEDGCKLITDESQYGWLTFMQKSFVPNKLRKLHDIWLQNIKIKAETK